MYDVIVFDEICLVDLTFLSRIRNFCNNNADKIIVATGDTKQLKPINAISNCHEDQKAYRNHCINTIFPNKYQS
jgi:ATP-dependent exoDNAse (exonuclease V) alpha subunit